MREAFTAWIVTSPNKKSSSWSSRGGGRISKRATNVKKRIQSHRFALQIMQMSDIYWPPKLGQWKWLVGGVSSSHTVVWQGHNKFSITTHVTDQWWKTRHNKRKNITVHKRHHVCCRGSTRALLEAASQTFYKRSLLNSGPFWVFWWPINDGICQENSGNPQIGVYYQ